MIVIDNILRPDWNTIIPAIFYIYSVFALRFENLLARNWSMKIFKHEKEEKLAGPTGNFAGPAPFLVASGLGPALNAKTVYYKYKGIFFRAIIP